MREIRTYGSERGLGSDSLIYSTRPTFVDALLKAKALVEALELEGTTVTVVARTFADATAWDSSTPAGTNGSYDFTVVIDKENGTQVTSDSQTMTITAIEYVAP